MPTDRNAGHSPRKSIALRAEELGPFLGGVLVFVALVYYSNYISSKFEAVDGWQSSSLYSAIFDWSAIQTGFAFGVYGFVIGKTDGFVQKIKETKAMRRFISYIRKANITGFLLTLTSIPLIVIDPKITSSNYLVYITVCLWFCVFVWSFMSFLRLAYNFGKLASVKDVVFKGA
jgi:hypothetical protein